jgi:hypothetical protein
VSQSFTNDAQPTDQHTAAPAAPRKSRTWLAAVLTAVALLIVGALIIGAVYAVSINRAVNGNLRHNSDQLPAETPTAKGEKARKAKASGLLSITGQWDPTAGRLATHAAVAVTS